MEKKLFCPLCGASVDNEEDRMAYFAVCSSCGNKTYYVNDPEKWIYVENSDYLGIHSFLNIHYAPRLQPNTWLELYAKAEEYDKLVDRLKKDEGITITKNDVSSRDFYYTRNGYEFSIRFISYVDCFIDPWWDGETFIEFAFVKKDHPDYKVYKAELELICSILFR